MILPTATWYFNWNHSEINDVTTTTSFLEAENKKKNGP